MPETSGKRWHFGKFVMKALISLDKPAWMERYRIVRATSFPLEGAAGIDGCELPRIEAALLEELAERRALDQLGRDAPDGLSPNNWLKQACYQVILSWHVWDFAEDIDDRIEAAGRLARGTKKEDRDIFQRGLVGLFANNPDALSVQDRKRLAAPMWYAFRHYVPPAQLNEFNRTFPGHKARRANWREHIELAFENWVVLERTHSIFRACNLDAFREKYPDHIEARVESELDDAYAARKLNRVSDEGRIDEEWPE